MGYSYPVVPWSMVPSTRQKLNRRRMVLVAGGLLMVLVVVITLIAVLSRITPFPCGRGCGPPSGNELITASQYSNQKWGYRVLYDSAVLSIAGQNADGVQLNTTDGTGAIQFTATPGSDVGGANQAALNTLSSSTFQNLRQIGPVRGAEIGLVQGQGTAWEGDYVDASGVTATPIGLLVFSATQNGVTITVTAFGAASNTNADLPYGLTIGKQLDFPVTNTLWKGQ